MAKWDGPYVVEHHPGPHAPGNVTGDPRPERSGDFGVGPNIWTNFATPSGIPHVKHAFTRVSLSLRWFLCKAWHYGNVSSIHLKNRPYTEKFTFQCYQWHAAHRLRDL